MAQESNTGEFSYDDARALETEDTTWIRIGETWVDMARVIAIGPLSNIWDEEQGKEGVPYPTGGVAVQIDSPHSDSQFIQSADVTVEEVMETILDLSEYDDEDDE